MTALQLEVMVAIFGLITGPMTIYFLARANARESARERQSVIDAAVKEATDPLREQLSVANQQISRRDRAIESRDARVNQLEDELRRMR